MSMISPGFQSPFTMLLSFEPLINKYERQLAEGASPDLNRQTLLERVSLLPELQDGIQDPAFFDHHKDLIRALLADYFPEDLTRNEIKAVGLPFSNFAFNLTQRFQSLLKHANGQFEFGIRDFDAHQMYIMSCCIILNNLYGTQLDFAKPLFYDIPSKEGVIRHFRILINADFLQVMPTSRAISLTTEDIVLLMDNYQDLDLWMKLFPPRSYLLKGFSIMTLFDATVENALSTFKGKLLDFDPSNFQQGLGAIFSSIFRVADLAVGYVLYPQEDMPDYESADVISEGSIVLPVADGTNNLMRLQRAYRALAGSGKYTAFSDLGNLSAEGNDSMVLAHLAGANYRSLILAPVTDGPKLLGVLEIASPRAGELNSITANKLDVVMPHFTDKLNQMAFEMENKIQAMIQRNFTTLHASVNWKFRQQAKLQFRLSEKDSPVDAPGEILFEGLVPMYGQVDVVGSSLARNLSVKKDLLRQLKSALKLLLNIQNKQNEAVLVAAVSELRQQLQELSAIFEVSAEYHLQTYLSEQVHPLLKLYQNLVTPGSVDSYLTASAAKQGKFQYHRRKYEDTIAKINQTLVAQLDRHQEIAQRIFPHYYERFKSDGIEHTLYIGQTISPRLHYEPRMVYLLRAWQLRTTCQMVIEHDKIRLGLPYALQVTSLILVYHTEIAIRFRMDEKRFDVDGTYNARFEMVKKRIDKAHIKGTSKRIIRPGRVTVVFTNATDRIQYLDHIQLLQQENLLARKVESFDVEDLQGLVGLKGLMIKVICGR